MVGLCPTELVNCRFLRALNSRTGYICLSLFSKSSGHVVWTYMIVANTTIFKLYQPILEKSFFETKEICSVFSRWRFRNQQAIFFRAQLRRQNTFYIPFEYESLIRFQKVDMLSGNKAKSIINENCITGAEVPHLLYPKHEGGNLNPRGIFRQGGARCLHERLVVA